MKWEISRTKPVGPTRGFAIPAFIHNWQYHYSSLKVYGDGLIDCWSSVDLAILKRKLDQGWVVTAVPTGAHISIHNLGGARVTNCKWECRAADLLKQVEELVNLLNPGRLGLINLSGEEDVVVHGKLRRAKLSITNGKPFRVGLGGEEIPGEAIPVFLHSESEFYLTSWFIYKDGSSRIGISSEISSLQEVATRMEDGDLRTSVANGARINIEGLGWFEAQGSYWDVKPKERVREAYDVLSILKGEPGSIQACRACFREYEENSNSTNRDRLKSAYEAVPEHLRIYCGDMDSKDGPIRKVLYADEPPTIEP